ncbi:MAG: hypothetical protein JWM16_6465 [Verrucomicrobiales bacterium]|nr:hypothetical protein [Verrucomicrobiales bacterium]
MARHLETFRELERLQVTALAGVKSQGLEGLAAMLARQQEIMGAIAKEKGELKPYLDQWEALQPEVRAKLRAGRPGEILEALETVAQGIQARHQEMFGADDPATAAGASGKQAGGDPAKTEKQPDLSQMINIYRALQ